MEQYEPLARLTLDTLPINIAVLDGDGTILLTNQSWDEFGDETVTSAGKTGTNYFAGIDMTDDEYAVRAVEGIKAVIDGDRSLFELEYPCDTPDQSLWFLMRVAPIPGDGDEVVVAHIDITERKLAELQVREQAQELRVERRHLEHVIHRINGLVRNVMEAVTAAETTADVLSGLCEQFRDTEPYVDAWVAKLDLGSDRLVPASGTLDSSIERRIDVGDKQDPVAIAADTQQLEVFNEMTSLPADSVHHEICPDAGSMAGVPLVANGSLYGVLIVYAEDAGAFDERETVILEALGRTIATAMNAIERKRVLTTDTVLDVEIAVTDDEQFLFALSRDEHCRLEYAGSVYRDDDAHLLFFLVEGIDPETVLTRASEDDSVVAVTHVSDFGSGSLFEFAMEEPPIVGTLASRGAETRSIVVSSGTARVEANLPAGGDVRALVNALSDAFTSAELIAVQERDRPIQSSKEFVSNLMDLLTDRQRTALQKAYVGGFFEWPRTTSGEELAASMDISPSTYHQHLRAAQRKLVTELFER
ncbi:MAG: bacterio-opsin activator domain-containing protein [Halapricum sp.]